MPLRPKPVRGNPDHSSETVYREMLNEWIADAMQDAAERIERAVERGEHPLIPAAAMRQAECPTHGRYFGFMLECPDCRWVVYEAKPSSPPKNPSNRGRRGFFSRLLSPDAGR